MVKIKLFLADTKSYISLNWNQSAGNTHLFKLIGELSPDNATLKKNWIWVVLEIKWVNTCIMLNSKEIHLPTKLLVPLIHKLNVKKLVWQERLNAHIHHVKAKKILVQSRVCTGLMLISEAHP